MLNNDFDVLVKKYQRYKREKRKSRNRRVLLFIIIGALAYYLSTQFSSSANKQPDINASKQDIIKQPPTITPTQEPKSPKEPQVLHETITEKKEPKKEESIPTDKESKKEKPIIKKPDTKPLKKESKNKKNTLKVTTQGKSLDQLLAYQSHSQTYSSTIAIANYYYSKKQYQETVKWAIEASKKNKSKVRPWILYAKSKKAQGKNDIAKKALSLFLKRHQSQEAQEILNSL